VKSTSRVPQPDQVVDLMMSAEGEETHLEENKQNDLEEVSSKILPQTANFDKYCHSSNDDTSTAGSYDSEG
jgi:hypothetical protein